MKPLEKHTIESQFGLLCNDIQTLPVQNVPPEKYRQIAERSEHLAAEALRLGDKLTAVKCLHLASLMAASGGDVQGAIRFAQQGLEIHPYPALKSQLERCYLLVPPLSDSK